MEKQLVKMKPEWLIAHRLQFSSVLLPACACHHVQPPRAWLQLQCVCPQLLDGSSFKFPLREISPGLLAHKFKLELPDCVSFGAAQHIPGSTLPLIQLRSALAAVSRVNQVESDAAIKKLSFVSFPAGQN